MKKLLILPLIALLAIPAIAKDKAAKGDKAGKPGHLIKQYDTNGNGEIDGDEKAAVQKAFDSDKTGPLKQFDTNNDGKLDDAELGAIKGHKKKDGAKKAAKA